MLTDVRLTSQTEWFAATCILESTTYDIVFRVQQYDLLQGETRELVHVEKDERPVADDRLWQEIAKAVNEAILSEECRQVRYSVEIDGNWQDTLEELIDQVLVCSPCCPTEALEFEIFSQIRQQLG